MSHRIEGSSRLYLKLKRRSYKRVTGRGLQTKNKKGAPARWQAPLKESGEMWHRNRQDYTKAGEGSDTEKSVFTALSINTWLAKAVTDADSQIKPSI